MTTGHANSAACLLRRPDVISRHNEVGHLIMDTLNRHPRRIRAVWDESWKEGPAPEASARLRPDLIVTNLRQNITLIIDVVITVSLEEAYNRKCDKYAQLATAMALETHRQVITGALAIAPWGNVFPASVSIMSRMDIPETDLKMLWKKILCKVINTSAYIFQADEEGRVHPPGAGSTRRRVTSNRQSS